MYLLCLVLLCHFLNLYWDCQGFERLQLCTTILWYTQTESEVMNTAGKCFWLPWACACVGV